MNSLVSRRILTILALTLFSSHVTTYGARSDSYQRTRKLLSKMNDVNVNSDKLAYLFNTGDVHIDDLIKALGDPERDISLRAQVVIRYLGNPKGVEALNHWYGEHESFSVAGPIPLPVSEVDYQFIYTNYVGKHPKDWFAAEKYIYALVLDDSPKAKTLLDSLLKTDINDDQPYTSARVIKLIQKEQPETTLQTTKDLARAVRLNSFFISRADRRYTTTRLLAFNGAKDKALVEVYINRGALSEEWYHVVLAKYKKKWDFFSITQVAIS